MRLSLPSRTGFGVLLALTACNTPAEDSDTSEAEGEETSKSSSEDDEEAASEEGAGSTKGQESQGSSATSAGTTTATSAATSSTSSTSTSTTGTEGPGETTDEEVETSDGTDTGPEPNRGCTGEPLPSVTLTPVITNLNNPTALRFIPSDPGHAYVSQRGGSLREIDLSNPNDGGKEILNVTASVSGECGLLSFDFHPNFDGVSERRLYVSHNPDCGAGFWQPGVSVLGEYDFNGETATYTRDVVSIEQPLNNHNGGLVLFGPDGYLYFALGDGGGSNDEFGHGQNPATAYASILRYDPDNLDVAPPGNLTSDMVGGADVFPHILHWGLRNPWQFSFDRVTGDLYIGDVGQSDMEEIDFLPAGAGPTNFGWPAFEGTIRCPGCQNAQLHAGVTDVKPIHEYAHPSVGIAGYSVTGGFVYRGSAIPELWGRYIYADYTLTWIAALTWDGADGSCDHGNLDERNAGSGVVAFAEDPDGELYIVNMTQGIIFRIDPA